MLSYPAWLQAGFSSEYSWHITLIKAFEVISKVSH
uniref:Uncharacterized protein n=1 Tax=uncultured Desulfobacterium sp. TaxID=201089 RepID=E1YC58_9BACT|nr:unknown protein [uncultured Desulfobacterium sp.]